MIALPTALAVILAVVILILGVVLGVIATLLWAVRLVQKPRAGGDAP